MKPCYGRILMTVGVGFDYLHKSGKKMIQPNQVNICLGGNT
jgi:hypothetical protein